MNDIKFNISEHWLPVNEKQGSLDKDTLRIKVSGINYHTKPAQLQISVAYFCSIGLYFLV